MEDDADIHDGIRAQFPLTFGKQSKAQTSLEAIHNATRRSNPNPTSKSSSSQPPTTTNDLPSLSASSKAWLDSLRNSKNPKPDGRGTGSSVIGPTRPPQTVNEDEDGGVMLGPPRPPLGLDSRVDDEEEDGAMIGPPRPPVGSGLGDEEDDDGEMIGPPRPPPGSNLGGSSSEDDSDEDEVGHRFRIPLSNEIVLKGHTKVLASSYLSLKTAFERRNGT